MLQTDDDRYFVASTADELEDADFVNHSCDPSCGIRETLTIVALRDIEIGEEITFDYAMSESSDYRMKCACGSALCRGVITGEDWKISELQKNMPATSRIIWSERSLAAGRMLHLPQELLLSSGLLISIIFMAKKKIAARRLPFKGKILMVGCGSIGQAILPLIFKHLDIKRSQLSIIEADNRGVATAKEFGVKHEVRALTKQNYKKEIRKRVGTGDFLLNLSVDTSSADILELCHRLGVLYLDTVAEPWTGFYTNTRLSAEERSNYALREGILALRRKYNEGPTAVSCMGANPGLVSSFIKQALLNIARDTGVKVQKPKNKEAWADLSQKLDIKVIHVAERDTQVSPVPKEVGEFVNTWSIDGFVSEGGQPSEMGWGTHEKQLPEGGRRHTFGCMAAIYMNRPGFSMRVRSWTPEEGPFHGFIITHNESISTSDYFSVKKNGNVVYRPTCHYAYHPCDAAVLSLHEMAGKNGKQQKRQRLIVDEITSGVDELGVLLMGHKKNAYWYGSQLTIEETRRVITHNNATSLQVAVAALAGMMYAIENPSLGIIEAEDLDHDYVLKISKPYLGKMVGKYSDWTPLQDRGKLFPEDLDKKDPWQFKNFRVV